METILPPPENLRSKPIGRVADPRVANQVDMFLSLMAKISKEKNDNHPRRNDGKTRKSGEFFMPMLFNNDILFTSCKSMSTLTSQYIDSGSGSNEVKATVTEANPDEPLEFDLFAPLKKTVAHHKSEMKRNRLAQLYSTSDMDADPKDWTSMRVLDRVDWRQFMKQERKRHMEMYGYGRETSHEDPLPIKEEIASLKSLYKSESSINLGGILEEDYDASSSTTELVPVKPVPLKIGVVKSLNMLPLDNSYFQIEPMFTDSILTIEVECVKGEVQAILGINLAPTLLQNNETIQVSSSERKRFVVNLPANQFAVVSIISKANSSCKIWCFMSQAPKTVAPLERTTAIINKFNNLAKFSDEELLQKFPELERLVVNSVKGENSNFSSKYNLNPSSNLLSAGESIVNSTVSADPVEKGDIEDNDLKVLDNFIFKSGRMNIRSAQESHRHEKVSVNSHEDLFPDRNFKLPNIKAAVSV